MILVDTSVWIDHLREGVPALADALQHGLVQVHPFVVGELACGNMKDRAQVLGLLQALPAASTATDDEALDFINRHSLAGLGIGYIDVHLLASVFLSRARLWTRDRRLAKITGKLGVGFTE